jgi:hypothetical protein
MVIINLSIPIELGLEVFRPRLSHVAQYSHLSPVGAQESSSLRLQVMQLQAQLREQEQSSRAARHLLEESEARLRAENKAMLTRSACPFRLCPPPTGLAI